jgi:hypothetical protein
VTILRAAVGVAGADAVDQQRQRGAVVIGRRANHDEDALELDEHHLVPAASISKIGLRVARAKASDSSSAAVK